MLKHLHIKANVRVVAQKCEMKTRSSWFHILPQSHSYTDLPYGVIVKDNQGNACEVPESSDYDI